MRQIYILRNYVKCRYRICLSSLYISCVIKQFKKEKKPPTVLSRQECKTLFKAPVNLKHRFLLAFAYAGRLRMNEYILQPA